MQIEALEIKNYRLFRDVKLVDLPRLTMVVGANGSGKSTLFDIFSFLKAEAGYSEHLSTAKIRVENRDCDIDLGFKVFKLSSSNIQHWNPDRSDLEESLLSYEEHIVQGRSELDILYDLLLKRGVDLTVPIENQEVAGKSVYSIGYGVLFACLDESINKDQIEKIGQGIVEWDQELAPSSDTHVFFRDNAFNDAVSKTNMAAILEQNGINHVRSLQEGLL